MGRFDLAKAKLNKSQSNIFDTTVIIGGESYPAAVDQYPGEFEGFNVNVIEVEILRSVAPPGLVRGQKINIGDFDRVIINTGGDEDYLIFFLDTTNG